MDIERLTESLASRRLFKSVRQRPIGEDPDVKDRTVKLPMKVKKFLVKR
jgi:hypothetical protein